MHRALAVHLRERFLGPGIVRSARASMVDTAVEVSLQYSPMSITGSASSSVDTRPVKTINIPSEPASKLSYLKQRRKS